MKIKEVIEHLNQYNPEDEVFVMEERDHHKVTTIYKDYLNRIIIDQ